MNKNKVRRLDNVFSKYIRLRDTDDNGYGKCISTGRLIHYSEADAGHFISRDRYSTRWNEKNVHLQSRQANRFKSGQQFSQSISIDRLYGEGTAELLLAESRRPSKLTDFEIDVLINHYKKEVKRLAKSKLFEVKA